MFLEVIMSSIIVHVCAESALAWLYGPALTLQEAEKDDSALRVYTSSCEELKLHMAKGRLYVKRITNMKKVAVI